MRCLAFSLRLADLDIFFVHGWRAYLSRLALGMSYFHLREQLKS
jgi:hypothetical protein